MREDQVANGVQFLTHPKVKQAPLEERIGFLRNKGMTEEEIDEAVRQAEGESGSGADGKGSEASSPTGEGMPLAGQQQPPPHAPHVPPPVNNMGGRYPGPHPREQSWAEKYLVPGTLALSAGAGMAFLYKTMVLKQSPQQWLGPWVPPGVMPGLSPPLSPSGAPYPPPMQQQMPGQMPGQPGAMNQAAPPMQQQQPMPPNTNSLPGAPGAMDALVAQGKPVPSASQYEMEKDNALVPFDQSSMFGKAPYATPDAMIALGGGVRSDGNSSGSNAAQEELLVVAKQQTDVLKQMSTALSDLTSRIDDLKGNNSNQGGGGSMNDKWVASMTQAHSDLRSELGTIKTLLLAKGGESGSGLSAEEIAKVLASSSTSSSSPSPSDSSSKTGVKTSSSSIDDLIKAANNTSSGSEATEETKEPEGPSDDELREKHIHESRTALAKMIEACAEDKKRAAVNMLLMYFRNLHKEPQVPRYGRIARTNASFTKALGDVEHHLEFLQANGFGERSSGSLHGSRAQMLEWSDDWRENADKWALDVLRDSITNLETVLKDVDERRKQQTAKPSAAAATLTSSSPSGVASSATNATPGVPPAASDKSEFKAAPFSLNKSRDDAPSQSSTAHKNEDPPGIPGFPASIPPAAPNATAPAAAPYTATSNASQSPPSSLQNDSEQRNEEVAGREKDDYPLSYSEVMAMVQKGEQPPGIKEIPNELSADAANPTESSMKPVPKPWEVPQAAPQTTNGVDHSSDSKNLTSGAAASDNASDNASYYHPSLFGNNDESGESHDHTASESAAGAPTFAEILRTQQANGPTIEEIQ